MEQWEAHSSYEFADFRLDTQRRVLSSRIDGLPIQVTGKVFDALVYFVEHAGVLLSKQTLLAALWPNVVVEESNLTQTIHTLRRVLGERPGEHRFIVTVPGRGYRFVADVTLAASEEAASSAAPERNAAGRSAWSRTRIWVAGLVAVAFLLAGLSFLVMRAPGHEPQRSAENVATKPAVAVLPFVDMSEAQDQTYFAEGLSEEILNLLAQSAAMRVIARTSSFSFKDHPDADITTIAHRLGATHVLEGSVRKSGEQMRITAQLVEGATSAHLWSRTYDRKVTDVFSVQDDIAAAVSAALNAALIEGEQPRADTTSAEAFELYLHGKYFLNRGGEADVTRAMEYFEQALRDDPNYARAWAGLAGTYTAAVGSGQDSARVSSRAWLESIERGLSLGPGLPEAHVRAAQYYWWLGDWETSEQHCKLAIALNPSDALVLTVSALKAIARGDRLEALSLQRRAVAVDPLSAHGRASLGSYLAAVGQFEAAEKELRHARDLSPTLPRIDLDIARVLVMRRRFEEALNMFEQMPASSLREQGFALAHYGIGNAKAADEALARLIAYAQRPSASAHEKIYVAEVHAFRGNTEQTLEWLERALGPAATRRMTAAMIDAVQTVQRSPCFIELHTDPRMQSLLGSGRFRQD